MALVASEIALLIGVEAGYVTEEGLHLVLGVYFVAAGHDYNFNLGGKRLD